MSVRYVVQECESLIQIAERFGFLPETIWQDPANASLRAHRHDMNVLMAGDILVIPDPRERSLFAHTGQRHVVRLRGIPAQYRLKLFCGDHPRAHENYELLVDGVLHRGRTNDRGVLEEWIPASARRGELTIGPDAFRLDIRFGALDPASDVKGAQQRLSNLGYLVSEPGSDWNEESREALLAFQRDARVIASGRLDPATIEALIARHDLVRPTGASPPNPNATETTASSSPEDSR